MTRLDLCVRCAAAPLVMSVDDSGLWTIRHKYTGFVWECVNQDEALARYHILRRNWLAMFREDEAA